jgi:hypothetical protein
VCVCVCVFSFLFVSTSHHFPKIFQTLHCISWLLLHLHTHFITISCWVLCLSFLISQFYFILNVAVGGVNGFFPDGAQNPGGKPWSNTSPQVHIHS